MLWLDIIIKSLTHASWYNGFGMTPMAVRTDNENGLPAADIAKASETMSGGEKDPARFVARKQNEDMQMRRKEEMMGDKRAVTIVKNTVSKGGDNYSEVRGGEIHRYVNDQGSVFQSNNA